MFSDSYCPEIRYAGVAATNCSKKQALDHNERSMKTISAITLFRMELRRRNAAALSGEANRGKKAISARIVERGESARQQHHSHLQATSDGFGAEVFFTPLKLVEAVRQCKEPLLQVSFTLD